MESLAPSELEKLAVIRFSALGDVALTVPVLMAFSGSYPSIRILMCTRPRFGPLFRDIPNVEVLPAELEETHKGINGLKALYESIHKEKPIGILDLHNVLRTKALQIYNRLYRTPYYKIEKGRPEKRRLTRSRKKDWRPLAHTTERYAQVFEAAGYPVSLTSAHTLPARSIEDQDLQAYLTGYTMIGIAPFAAHPAKMYDLEKMEEVVAWLDAKDHCRILIFGGGTEEQQQAQPWEDRYANCVNLIGQYEFAEELNVISQLDLMISMDSGNGHLSAIFGVPTLSLWGVTHPFAGFAPFGQPAANSLLADRTQYPAIPTSVYGNRCPDGYEDAINTIAVSEIQARIKAILKW